ncbi:hypothetical protein GCM10010216_48250 [Streptomyces flaveolus]|jgi:hypothetical protein|nr:hypothetical protein GCM10010216_48250 [Streptomyces flaveolus]
MTVSGAVRPGDLVTVTHRPHPLVGRRLTVRAVRGRGAGKLLCERPGGGLVTVLPSWTDRALGAVPDQERESCRETPGESRSAARPRAGGAAFPISDTALYRLRASLALSVERFVGLDTVKSSVTEIPLPSLRYFSAGEKEKPTSRLVRKEEEVR